MTIYCMWWPGLKARSSYFLTRFAIPWICSGKCILDCDQFRRWSSRSELHCNGLDEDIGCAILDVSGGSYSVGSPHQTLLFSEREGHGTSEMAKMEQHLHVVSVKPIMLKQSQQQEQAETVGDLSGVDARGYFKYAKNQGVEKRKLVTFQFFIAFEKSRLLES
uniref:Uncharacterized protein n=1 Tax=Daphnia galeata TaxID=27404 RepID=A0A8J2RS11_9CRUS|nr:unnamed protein product [Daphnia galeata]